ncbi:diacylglycerol/lipid kinase family protein [Crassaminicella profunda]|uniref:diacylglycerol/lipid kinase family protein n=1 Tax=Crassaminicella profunda TaxID=1286698 RepID=UPI001CA62BA4|nr:diacylglycerol kinase family protein [Crassaminicella profunda]QZY55074.1 diacylglycerol kinase family lipid kinase [Crassaminicella profunda]
MDILFIVNPVAGKGNCDFVIGKIKEQMDFFHIPYKIKLTTRKNEAEEIAKDAVIKGYEKIVAVGGDGTIYEVVNGMIGSSASLGVIPSGTGNDFVRTVGIPNDLEKALNVIAYGKKVQIDCGKVNDRYFVNVASIGLDAEIVKETENIKKYLSGSWAYMGGLLKTLFSYKHKRVNMNIDGSKKNKNITLVAVANGKYYGGGMKIAPMADIKDGDFQVCIVDKISKFKLMRVFPKIFSGEHVHYDEVDMHKGKQVKIKSDEHLSINLDGDIIGKSFNVYFQMVPEGLKVLVPQDNIM